MPEVQIDRLPGPVVIIRHDYSDEKRQAGTKAVIAICILGSIPVVTWLFFRNDPAAWMPTLIAAIVVAGVIERIVTQFTAVTRSCVLRADESGLSIDLADWRKRTTTHFNKTQIADIALDGRCSIGLFGADLKNRMFHSMLVITPCSGSAVHCLHNVSGEQLARAADALRTALGMPARSWP